MASKKPSYEVLLARHKKTAAKQAERSKAFLERKKEAGLKRIQLWVPEALLKQEIDGHGRKIGGIVFVDADETKPFFSHYRTKNNDWQTIWPANPQPKELK